MSSPQLGENHPGVFKRRPIREISLIWVSEGDCTKKPTVAVGGVLVGRSECMLSTADRVIRWSSTLAVFGVAAVAAVASYEHAYDLVRAHGEAGWTARLIPLTVDGLIYARSMVMLDSARRETPVPPLARWLLGLGIGATLAGNIAHGLGHDALHRARRGPTAGAGS